MPKFKALYTSLTGLLLGLMSGLAHADWQLNMEPGVSPITKEVYDLHMIILWIVVVIGVFVFGAIIWSMIYHRKSRGVQPAQFHENHVIELVWTVVPFLILVAH